MHIFTDNFFLYFLFSYLFLFILIFPHLFPSILFHTHFFTDSDENLGIVIFLRFLFFLYYFS